jgi:hypothetical protein
MAESKWHINGDYILACNCDFGCPCNFNARPSSGSCQGSIGFQVADGAYNGVNLDGTKAMVTVKWPGAIHEGNGVAAIYIGEDASQEQREALENIITGKAGGMPWALLAGTWSHILPIRYTPIKMTLAGEKSSVEAGDYIKFSFQPIRNPVTKVEAYPKVVLPQGFIFKEGDQYALKEFWVNDTAELNFSHPGKCAELAKVSWQGA